MKNTAKVGMGLAAILLLASPVFADLYTFTPNDPDLLDLPHQAMFMWGVNWKLPAGEVITAAHLTYKNIYDWTRESNDRLYTHLLDSVPDPNGRYSPNYQSVGTGKRAYERITVIGADDQGGGDNFAGMPGQVLLGTWTDPSGGSPRNFNLVYEIDNLAMLSDGSFGIGIDPDCHYFNSGIYLTIETGIASVAVPAPAAGGLAVIGLAILAWRLLARSKAELLAYRV